MKNRRLTGHRSFLLGLGASVATGPCATVDRPRQLNDAAQILVDQKRDFALRGDASLRARAIGSIQPTC